MRADFCGVKAEFWFRGMRAKNFVAWEPDFVCGMRAKFCLWHESRVFENQVLFCRHGSQILFFFWHESLVFDMKTGFWLESQVFGMIAGFWRESQVFGFQKCKYRLRVASLLNGIASIDGVSLPCSFSCEYPWNVASSRVLGASID